MHMQKQRRKKKSFSIELAKLPWHGEVKTNHMTNHTLHRHAVSSKSCSHLTAIDLSASPMIGNSMVTLFSQWATTSSNHLVWLDTCNQVEVTSLSIWLQ